MKYGSSNCEGTRDTCGMCMSVFSGVFSLSLSFLCVTNIVQARILCKERQTGDADIFRSVVQFFVT